MQRLKPAIGDVKRRRIELLRENSFQEVPNYREAGHDQRRIAGEALINAQRHSGASLVKVTISSADGFIKLEIVDNGRGFICQSDDLYPFVSKGKLGLVSMKERTEMAGGTFLINSTPAGTAISVSIPLDKPRES
jgi:signal transduction histidine kinase